MDNKTYIEFLHDRLGELHMELDLEYDPIVVSYTELRISEIKKILEDYYQECVHHRETGTVCTSIYLENH